MNEKPAADRSLQELIRLSEELQERSTKLAAESKSLDARCVEIIERSRRLWEQRND
jgi:predicted transcriptional regulator